MRPRNLTLWIVLGIVVIILFWGCSGYNGLVKQDEVVKQSWGNVQSDYQRRADLIPNLVATVKGAADFEKETYTQVALARAGQLKQAANVSVDSLTPQRIQQIQQASTEALNATRMAINIAVERYPDLKATGNFSSLQTQLEGTENRINTSRKDFNTAVRDYNVRVRAFPTNIFAGMFGFKQRQEFQAQPNADQAPKVQF
jgi:LemA protein